jgi:hypothetical protein
VKEIPAMATSLESALFPKPGTDSKAVRRAGAGSPELPRAPELPELPQPALQQVLAESALDKPARPVAAEAPAAPKSGPGVVRCPRCQNKLIDPNGLGWCQRCGYCHSLEQDRAKVPVKVASTARPKADPNILDFVLLLVKVPVWFWMMLLVAAALVAMTWLAVQRVQPTPFPRCIWCTVQIAAGMLLVFAGEFWALLRIAHTDEIMTAKDLFLPARLWGLTIARLPGTRFQIWLAAWGIALIAGALIFVGGLPEWFKHIPKAAKPQAAVQSTTRTA